MNIKIMDDNDKSFVDGFIIGFITNALFVYIIIQLLNKN